MAIRANAGLISEKMEGNPLPKEKQILRKKIVKILLKINTYNHLSKASKLGAFTSTRLISLKTVIILICLKPH